MLLGLTRHVLAPLLRALGQTGEGEGAGPDGGSGERDAAAAGRIHAARRRLAELESLLAMFAETSAVPEVRLAADGVPEVAAAAAECALQGRRLRLGDLGLEELASSSGSAGAGGATEPESSGGVAGSFLDRCVAAVSQWGRESRRLTRWPQLRAARAATEAQAMISGEGVEPEAASDGRQAASEVAQWRQADASLKRLEQQLEGYAVHLTLECLQRGKRTVVAAGFMDTTGARGARQRLDQVMTLVRDVPVDSIAVADRLPALRGVVADALAAIGRVPAPLVDMPFLSVLLARMAADVRTGVLRCLAHMPPAPEFAGKLSAEEKEASSDSELAGPALAAAAARSLMFAPVEASSAAMQELHALTTEWSAEVQRIQTNVSAKQRQGDETQAAAKRLMRQVVGALDPLRGRCQGLVEVRTSFVALCAVLGEAAASKKNAAAAGEQSQSKD